jgi:phospholipid transport system substrate-binding protein
MIMARVAALAVWPVLTLVLMGAGGTKPAGAGNAPSPMPWLKSTVEKARKLATRQVQPDSPQEEAWRADVKKTVDDILAWDQLTERALGRHWQDRTPKEREEFAKLLREMIEASYESKMRMSARGKLEKPAEVKIDWGEEKIEGDTGSALAKIKADKTKADLLFHLSWDGTRWRVFDIEIDGVSTVRTYRTQFGKLMERGGFSAVLERMRKKVAELRSGKGELSP